MRSEQQVSKYKREDGVTVRWFWHRSLKVHSYSLDYPCGLKITDEQLANINQIATTVCNRFDKEAWADTEKYERKHKIRKLYSNDKETWR